MTQHGPPGSSWADGPGGATISSPTFSQAPTYNTSAQATELPPSPPSATGHGYRGVSLAPPVELPGAEAREGQHGEGKTKYPGSGTVGEMPDTPAKSASTPTTGYGHARSPSDIGPGDDVDAISRGGVSPSLPSPQTGTQDSGRFAGGGYGGNGGNGGNGGLPPYSASGAYGGGRFEEDFGHGGTYRR